MLSEEVERRKRDKVGKILMLEIWWNTKQVLVKTSKKCKKLWTLNMRVERGENMKQRDKIIFRLSEIIQNQC